MQGQPAPDPVETRIDGVEPACRALEAHVPELLERLARWTVETRESFDTGLENLIDRAGDAITICLARMLLRNGSAAALHRAFHDERHIFDLMRRLRRLYGCATDSLDSGDYIALALFCAGHDLRQDLEGTESDGVGRNERASALELERILVASGFQAEAHAGFFRVLRPMIDGTTFRIRPFEYRGRVFRGGVLAPALVAAADDPETAALSAHEHNLVLLATDIDTGNVADSFDCFMDRGCRLCRERFALDGNPKLDGSTAAGVLEFLTTEQERYFFELQRFHAPESRACFQADRDANAALLEGLGEELRTRFRPRLEAADPALTGEEIVAAVAERSRQMV